jgi:hypothetical protein
MQAQPEFRKSERFCHESIIKLEDDLTLSPYYAVSYNLSETGMNFKSLFELYGGARIRIRIDDYTLCQNPIIAKVVWCKELKNQTVFRYGVGVEFLNPVIHFGSKASLPISSRMKTSNDIKREDVIQMEKRVSK